MALLDLETIKEAVVLEHEDESGEKRLVAYLVSAGPVVKKFVPFPRRLDEGQRPSGQVILSTLNH